jgi:anti-sigma-K factor RskA
MPGGFGRRQTVKLARHRQLDALIGEYVLGTLRGGARRRFERALRDESAVALRLRALQQYAPSYGEAIVEVLPANGWQRLFRKLNLSQYRAPWYARTAFLRAWAFGATAALLFTGTLLVVRAPTETPLTPIAQLASKGAPPSVTAQISRDGTTLRLVAGRPIVAGPLQSYELWLIPGENAAPVSLAVLGTIDATLRVPGPLVGRLRPGAQLAISVEPPGGSPTGAPTGPVILSGAITS